MVLGAVARPGLVGLMRQGDMGGSGGSWSEFLVLWPAGQGETIDRSVSLFPEETQKRT